jgi:Protein of unknown function (DUF3575)
MKNIFLLNLFLFFGSSCFAQDSLSVSNNLLKLNIIRTGFSYEKSISKLSTLNVDANLTPFFIRTNSGANVTFFPYLNGQYRYYYNLEKRHKKSKTVSGNSANYIAFGSSYYFKSLGVVKYESFNNGFSTSVIWGLQRTNNKKMFININSGIGYNFGKTINSKIKPIINFTIGWIILDK